MSCCFRGGAITSLAYHPSRNMAASTSSSGDVKIWVQQVAGKKGKAAHWRCQSVGTHSGIGNKAECMLLPMTASPYCILVYCIFEHSVSKLLLT